MSFKSLNSVRQLSVGENEDSLSRKITKFIGKCHKDVLWMLATDEGNTKEIQLFSSDTDNYKLIQTLRLPTSISDSDGDNSRQTQGDEKIFLLKRFSCLVVMSPSHSYTAITLTSYGFDEKNNQLNTMNQIQFQNSTCEEHVINPHSSCSVSYDERSLAVVQQLNPTRSTKQRNGFCIYRVAITRNPLKSNELLRHMETRLLSFEQLSRVGYGDHEAGKPYLDCHLVNNGGEVLIVKSSPKQTYLSNHILSTFLLYSVNKNKMITSIQRPSAELGYTITKTQESRDDYIIRTLQNQSVELMKLSCADFGMTSRVISMYELGLDDRVFEMSTHNGCLFLYCKNICYMIPYDRLENGNIHTMTFKMNLQTQEPLIQVSDRFMPSLSTDFNGFDVLVFRVFPTKERLNQLDVFQVRSCNSLYELCCRRLNSFAKFYNVNSLDLPRTVIADLASIY